MYPDLDQPYSLEYLVNTLKVTIPARRMENFRRLVLWVGYHGIFTTLFLYFVLSLAVDWRQWDSEVFTNPSGVILIFIAFSFLANLFRILKPLGLLLWQFGGVETIQLSLRGLELERRIFGIPLRKSYPAEGKANLSVSLPAGKRLAFGRGNFGVFIIPEAGPLVYASGERQPVRFGLGLAETEAQTLAETVHKRFPHLRPTPARVP